MKAQMENFEAMSAQASGLIALHWQELYGAGGFRTDYGGMIEMEKTGNFAYFTLRTDEGELAGHAGFQVMRSPFYGVLSAIDIFYYVLPQHRGGFGICKLLKLAGQMLKVKGVQQIMISHKKEQDIGVLIERSGFEKSGEVYQFKE